MKGFTLSSVSTVRVYGTRKCLFEECYCYMSRWALSESRWDEDKRNVSTLNLRVLGT